MKNNLKYTIATIFISIASIVYYATNPVNRFCNTLQLLVIHCTATPANMYIDGKTVILMHTSPKNQGGRGWRVPGYADVIKLDGQLEKIVKYNKDSIIQGSEITNGSTDYNRISRHIVYAGGLDSITKKPTNTLNAKQDSTLKYYCKAFIKLHPNGRIIGHNQVANKACPCFDVPDKIRSYGIPETNTIRGRLK